jgi:hypothetical protein
LSQQRLFSHLRRHGYNPLPSSPSVFRNSDGTIRFTLVVDDFAVVWTNQKAWTILSIPLLNYIRLRWTGKARNILA